MVPGAAGERADVVGVGVGGAGAAGPGLQGEQPGVALADGGDEVRGAGAAGELRGVGALDDASAEVAVADREEHRADLGRSAVGQGDPAAVELQGGRAGGVGAARFGVQAEGVEAADEDPPHALPAAEPAVGQSA